MAGDWIKLEHATPDKPEVFELAELLTVSRGDAFLYCVRFWIWLDQQSRDGRRLRVSKVAVDELLKCPGIANALIRVAWLGEDSDGLFIPNFDKHNGETSKKRALKNQRQSLWRQNRDADVDGNVDARRASKASTREEKRRSRTTLSGEREVALQVLAYLNEKAGREYRPVAANLGLIEARLREGASVEDCRRVVDRQCSAWSADEKMREYLRPATLFNREKFSQYVGAVGALPLEKRFVA